jgi:hypothetical protein
LPSDLCTIPRSKIGEGEANALVEFNENMIAETFGCRKDEPAAKHDIYNLDVKNKKTKEKIIRLMCISRAGQTGIVVGILALFNK